MKTVHKIWWPVTALFLHLVLINGQSPIFNKQKIHFSSEEWVCKNNKCEKAVENDYRPNITSFITCNMLCSLEPPLWPKPKYIDILNKASTSFQKEHVFLKIHSPSEIKTDLQNAANIFLSNLQKPSSKYSLIEGDDQILKINLHVKESTTKLSSSTNESYSIYSQKLADGLVVNIFANTYFGARHGLETLSQLIWFDIHSDRFRILHDVNIQDEPNFKHRGLMIDVSRNYFPVELLKKSIDGMAASKLNVLHLHVSDSSSFPLILPHYKFFAENGAYSSEKIYTPEDIKDLVEYARIRGIRTILEIDAPSHVSFEAWPKNYTLCGDQDIFKTTLDPDNPQVFDMLQNIYLDLFQLGTDNETFHIGDDEVIMDCWRNTKSAKNYGSLYTLWSSFTNKMMQRVKNANNNVTPKNIVLWSSPLTDQYIKDLEYQKQLVVQYWFGEFRHILENGYKIIFSTVGEWYLDCGFGPWRKDQQHGSCDPYTDWKKMYKYRPWKDYTDRIDQVLGGEVCLWSEQVSPDDLETRLWPRSAAFAERMWSDPDIFYKDDVFRRIDFHSRRLKERGIRVAAIWPQICSLYPDQC